jgi:hypothetical protein
VIETQSRSRERRFLPDLPSRDPSGRAALLTQEGVTRFRNVHDFQEKHHAHSNDPWPRGPRLSR